MNTNAQLKQLSNLDHLLTFSSDDLLDENGNKFKGQSLLYLHKSGRGGLMSYNPSTEQISLCAQPKGGLRPSEAVKEFAAQWLYKVNVLQDGVTRDEDMIPVNYNGEDF